eukprot:2284963-Prymnesium_polylepis.1
MAALFLSLAVPSNVRPVRPAAFPATPHSGFHMRERARGFEGWYHRLTIGDESLAFIYSIFDPADSKSPRHGVGAQLCGPADDYIYKTSADITNFWADERQLRLGHTFRGVAFARETPPASFRRFVEEGFQLSAQRHQGQIAHPEGGTVKWCYDVTPLIGWGGDADAQRQYSTAGWLAALPVFEPHYQVLMAHGEADGYVEWRGRRLDFARAPCYTEKNWGACARPLLHMRRTPSVAGFWLQCNTFDEQEGEQATPAVTLTSAGGARGNPLLPGRTEDVALIAVHTAQEFYPFANVEWEIAPWGSWVLRGELDDLSVIVEAHCDPAEPGVNVLCPSAGGMVGRSRETFEGKLSVRLWRRLPGGGEEPVLEANTRQAALEVGGTHLDATTTWRGACEVGEAARSVLAADVPLPTELLPGL